ncbi:MAG: HAD family hydrolase [Alphaproteobacteria bacterium]|nr:HAD family hydrolase [Alphaproteobacteria bacterium]
MSLHLAVWSGPRNLSTAMMRSWAQRADTAVVDEPLYAHYLATTGIDHPGRDEVIASQPTDAAVVTASLCGPIPGGRAVHYQKHMTHHLLPDVPRGWMARVHHAFLLRDPREVLLSYVRSRAEVTVEDLGVPQQEAILAEVDALGQDPVVIDAGRFLRDPERQLRAWCAREGLPFDAAMLSWAPGPRPEDGVWGPHWYASLWASTGFEPWKDRDRTVPERHRALIDACWPAYERMLRRALP